ncbi:S1C family serine protease [Thalassoroseus pseudoceratinae]|uniref:S1C family serine protease n=1 Tax=Thalassoroseus pseudoceratinae TaxID=2713176 RepID=UPI001422FC73|nr:trypsin-like peptidase domain-containing protein [Thalassoroseus pseudoceratinae]
MFRTLLVFAVAFATRFPLAPHDSDALRAEEVVTAYRKLLPESINDLRDLEKAVRKVTKRVIKSTVGVQVGPSQGSGVIVSEDGYVLTAAHVVGGSSRSVVITLSDGREVKGTSLGLNAKSDTALVKINESGTWPAVKMAESNDVRVGDWCLSLGHPGGYQEDRPPVLRVGRVLLKYRQVLQTDCTLIGGDSGGPLFDLNGEVIGIHSRIGERTSWNFHVPVELYRENWDRLVVGRPFDLAEESLEVAYLGVGGDDHQQGVLLTVIGADTPAEAAGLKEGDIIVSVDGNAVTGFNNLARRIRRYQPNDKVVLEIIRDDEKRNLTVKLVGRRVTAE